MIRYHNTAPVSTGMTLKVREMTACIWKNSSNATGVYATSDVSLTIAIVSLPVGGTITRIACGSTIRRSVAPRLSPSAAAASVWPGSID